MYPYFHLRSYTAPQPMFVPTPFVYYPHPFDAMRQQGIRGIATWTDGGETTKCGIPWSDQEYMTAAVGENSPFRCGQMLKIRNLSAPYGREIIVKVVDEVPGYQDNEINLHRRAFQALGVNPNIGRLNIEIFPSPQLEEEKWGKYLLEVTQAAYPGYQVTDYKTVRKSRISEQQIRETYEFQLQSPQETITVQGNVIYNPNTDRIVSFDIKEM